MPTAKAKAAFNLASQLSAEMRDIHAKEEALNQAIESTEHAAVRDVLEAQLIRLGANWNRLHREFSAAFDEYTAAVQEYRAK